jgi:hypothetical protein
LINNEFTKRDEIIFVCYDEIIKNIYPYLLRQIITKYQKQYKEFIDIESFVNLDDKNLLRLVIQRSDKNLLRYLSLKSFDYDGALTDLKNKFNEMYINSPLLIFGQSINFLLSQKFTKKIYIYTPNYDKRIHFDIQMTYKNMDVINYVTGDFTEVVQSLDGITTWVLNDVIDITTLIEFKKTEYTNILVLNSGFNYTKDEDDKLVLRINIDDIVNQYIFKFATFDSINLTKEYFME